MQDVCYAVNHNFTFAEVKTAMKRIKKFLKDGFYLHVEENPPERACLIAHGKRMEPIYTVRVMGPPKFKAPPKTKARCRNK